MSYAEVRVVRGRNLVAMDKSLFGKASSDPYCVVYDSKDKKMGRSEYISKSLEPVWNYQCQVQLHKGPGGRLVRVELFDYDMGSANDPMGEVVIDLEQYVADDELLQWFDVTESRKGGKFGGEVEVYVKVVGSLRLNRGENIAYHAQKMTDKARVGLQWDSVAPIDLDVSCVFFSETGEFKGALYWGCKSLFDGAARHGGDDRTGERVVGDIDDEEVFLDLRRLPHEIYAIYVLATAYDEKSSFGVVTEGRARMIDADGDVPVSIALNSQGDHTALIVCRLIRDHDEGEEEWWDLLNISQYEKGPRDYGLMVPKLKGLLRDVVPDIVSTPADAIRVPKKGEKGGEGDDTVFEHFDSTGEANFDGFVSTGEGKSVEDTPATGIVNSSAANVKQRTVQAPKAGSFAEIRVIKGRNLVAMDTGLLGGKSSDPYVTIYDGDANKVGKSEVVKRSLNPQWNYGCNVQLENKDRHVTIQVLDYDRFSSNDPMGMVVIDLDDVKPGEQVEKWFPIVQSNHGGSFGGDLYINARVVGSLDLKKGEDIHYIDTKLTDKARVGLMWEGTDSVDLDASCVFFDGQGNFLDALYYDKLSCFGGLARHGGDRRRGDIVVGDDDDEEIFLDLKRMPDEVHVAFVVATAYTVGTTFQAVETARARLIDADEDVPCTVNIKTAGPHSAIVLCRLVRSDIDNHWNLLNVSKFVDGPRHYGQLVPTLKNLMVDIVEGIMGTEDDIISVAPKSSAAPASDAKGDGAAPQTNNLLVSGQVDVGELQRRLDAAKADRNFAEAKRLREEMKQAEEQNSVAEGLHEALEAALEADDFEKCERIQSQIDAIARDGFEAIAAAREEFEVELSATNSVSAVTPVDVSATIEKSSVTKGEQEGTADLGGEDAEQEKVSMQVAGGDDQHDASPAVVAPPPEEPATVVVDSARNDDAARQTATLDTQVDAKVDIHEASIDIHEAPNEEEGMSAEEQEGSSDDDEFALEDVLDEAELESDDDEEEEEEAEDDDDEEEELQVAEVKVWLDMDVSVEDFESEYVDRYIEVVADITGVDPDTVAVTRVEEGSIICTTTIMAPQTVHPTLEVELPSVLQGEKTIERLNDTFSEFGGSLIKGLKLEKIEAGIPIPEYGPKGPLCVTRTKQKRVSEWVLGTDYNGSMRMVLPPSAPRATVVTLLDYCGSTSFVRYELPPEAERDRRITSSGGDDATVPLVDYQGSRRYVHRSDNERKEQTGLIAEFFAKKLEAKQKQVEERAAKRAEAKEERRKARRKAARRKAKPVAVRGDQSKLKKMSAGEAAAAAAAATGMGQPHDKLAGEMIDSAFYKATGLMPTGADPSLQAQVFGASSESAAADFEAALRAGGNADADVTVQTMLDAMQRATRAEDGMAGVARRQAAGKQQLYHTATTLRAVDGEMILPTDGFSSGWPFPVGEFQASNASLDGQSYACKSVEITSEKQLDHLRTECRFHSVLGNNPHIVGYRMSWEERDEAQSVHTVNILTELCTSDLWKVLTSDIDEEDPAERRPSVDEATAWAFQLVRALACLEEHEVVHRKVSAKSIQMLAKDDKARGHVIRVLKLGNLGYCVHCPLGTKLRGWHQHGSPSLKQRDLDSPYAAPELGNADETGGYDRGVDVFASALVLFAMWQSAQGVDGAMIPEQMAALAANGNVPEDFDCPFAYGKLILRMVAKDPLERPSVAECLYTLHTTFSGGSGLGNIDQVAADMAASAPKVGLAHRRGGRRRSVAQMRRRASIAF